MSLGSSTLFVAEPVSMFVLSTLARCAPPPSLSCHELTFPFQIFCGVNGKIADFSIAPLKYDTLTSLLTERRESTSTTG